MASKAVVESAASQYSVPVTQDGLLAHLHLVDVGDLLLRSLNRDWTKPNNAIWLSQLTY